MTAPRRTRARPAGGGRGRSGPLLVAAALAVPLAGCARHAEPPPASSMPRSSSTSLSSSTPLPTGAAPLPPAPACAEAYTQPGPWPRASAAARVVLAPAPGLGHLEQGLDRARPTALRFLGAHLFDLLDKLDREGGPSDADRRRVICAALNAVALDGAPVLRLWGSLKRTGDDAEVARAAALLALVVDENARRERPLRFVVTLLNHQPGYGAPDPERGLDDQDPASPWSARRVYLEGGWRAPGTGLIGPRIEAFRARPALVAAPSILGWELVNELDTHRVIRGPEDASALRDGFVGPALALLAESFSQPILLGDLRAPAAAYDALAGALLAALPDAVKRRLIWTSHVYAPVVATAGAKEIAASTWKLDRDLDLAARHGLPFLLGEIGQRTTGGDAGFCRDGAPHALRPLFDGVLDPPKGPPLRREIGMALFWGEGRCALPVPSPSGERPVTIGAGGDSADLGPGEAIAREAVREVRRRPRFVVETTRSP